MSGINYACHDKAYGIRHLHLAWRTSPTKQMFNRLSSFYVKDSTFCRLLSWLPRMYYVVCQECVPLRKMVALGKNGAKQMMANVYKPKNSYYYY